MIDMKEYALMCVDEADVNGLSENRQTALEKLSTEDNTVILWLSATERQGSWKELGDFYDYDILRFPMPGALPELHRLWQVPNTTFTDVVLPWELRTQRKTGDVSDEEANQLIKQSQWIEKIIEYHLRNHNGRSFILGMRNNKLNDLIIEKAKEKHGNRSSKEKRQ